jgi:hypothetical protein
MKTLEQIKDEVAVDYGYSDFEDMESNILFEGHDTEDMPAFDAIAKDYAQQACEDLRERIAEKSFEMYKESGFTNTGMKVKQSILNTEIILP